MEKEEPDPEPFSTENNIKTETRIESSSWELLDFQLEEHVSFIVSQAVENAVKNYHDHQSIYSVSLLLGDDQLLQKLNNQFRGKNCPTNVLSFPYHSIKDTANQKINMQQYLGDIAISYDRVLKESIDEGKSFKDHFTYILIHGILHLLGYDHVKDEDAALMEETEFRILHTLNSCSK